MMKKYIVFILTIVSTTILANEGGKVGFSFLKIGVNSRAAGMGEAYTAVANDASATYWNPAGLASANNNSVILTHNVWLEEITHNFAAVQLFNGVHNIAFSLNMISVPGIEIRDETPSEKPVGTMSAYNLYLGVSYATKLSKNWLIGGQVKYLYEKYYLEDAGGIAFDLGLLKKQLLTNLDWGLSIQNIGWMEKLKNERTELPLMFKSGIGYKLPWKLGDDNILMAADLDYVVNDVFRVNVGSEISLLHMLSVRLGYILGSDTYDFTAGFGLQFNWYHLSYAYIPFKYDLGNSHRFSVDINLN